ncbi:hypothetical protein [Paenisporosarcina quisquiliarum]|uniref:hypothetical protein n=1 Tax=Paenisporosarcina quisquiliarum TaxID=365346 RepID=UPI003734C281
MNKNRILFHIILGILGCLLFYWSTRYTNVDITDLPFYLMIFIVLTAISIALWKFDLKFSYYISIFVLFYFFFAIVAIDDASNWFYYIVLLLPIGVIILTIVGFSEKILKDLSWIN